MRFICTLLLLATPGFAFAEAEVGYDKGFVIKDGAFKLKTQGRVQTRYQLDAVEAGDDRENSQAFSVARARLKLSGHVYDKNVKYVFQTDFGKGKAGLKDFFITYVASKDVFEIQAGQFKRPYSRHQLTSSGKQEFVDRSITDKALPTGRDVGLMIGSGRKAKLEWELGVFNGSGENTVPDDFVPAVVARAAYNHGKIKGYSDADLEGGPLRFAVGANLHTNVNATSDEDPMMIAGLDAIVKASGFSALLEGHRDIDAEVTALTAQAGYVLSGKYQPVARFAMVMDDATEASKQEITAGLSVYWFGHNLKWQTEFSALGNDDGADNTTQDYRVRSQVQLAF